MFGLAVTYTVSIFFTVQEFTTHSGIERKENIRSILAAVDEHYCQLEHPTAVQEDDQIGNSLLMKELQSAQAENQALKAHMIGQLEEMRRENLELKRSLEESNASCALEEMRRENLELKRRLDESNALVRERVATEEQDRTPDTKLKHFNAIPRSLKLFYDQMKHGDDKLPAFSELEMYKTNRSTKGAYCKRKAIYNYIESCNEGVQVFFENHKHLSTLQLYEHCIKKTRQNL